MTEQRFSRSKLRRVEHRTYQRHIPIIGECFTMRVIHFRTSRLAYDRARHPLMRRPSAASSLRNLVLCVAMSNSCALLMTGCSGGDEFRGAPAPRRMGRITVTATATGYECPIITSYTMSPYINAAGRDVALTSSTNASSELTPVFQWSASSGSFVNADQANSTYRCGAEANPTITLTVSYGNCVDSILIDELDCT